MRTGFAVAAALATMASPSAAQQATQRQAGFSLEDLNSKLAMVESLADLTSWLGPKPDPVPEFSYTEKRRFDMQLNQSLAAQLPIVNVRVDGAFARSAMPERMSQWLNAVEKSGGTIRYCAVTQDRALLALLGAALKLGSKVDKWLLYRPAAGYDAMVVTDATEGRVLNAVFTERGSVSDCPQGTENVGAGPTS